jgi:ABC-type multidrug transport system ATPase subunit
MTLELFSMADVCVSYGRRDRRVEILRSVSLDIAIGEIAAVVGSEGDGRTTLLKVAAGMVCPDSGRVTLNGIDLPDLSDAERTGLLGDQILWINRKPPPREWSQVHKYVALPLVIHGCRPREAERIAWEALDRMGVSGCGLRSWHTLSERERMLVELACGVAVRPQLMVIDDLFDDLGLQRTQEAGRILHSLTEELKCGILLSVSNLESARAVDRVWRLEKGSLIHVSERLVDHSNIAMADELYERGHRDIAAVIAGVSLEEHLRRLAVKNRMPIKREDGSPLKADALNNALVVEGIYNRLQQKGITAWLDLRNKAAHCQHTEYDTAQVSAFIRDIRNFMTRFPA